jgi:hypothetical protein
MYYCFRCHKQFKRNPPRRLEFYEVYEDEYYDEDADDYFFETAEDLIGEVGLCRKCKHKVHSTFYGVSSETHYPLRLHKQDFWDSINNKNLRIPYDFMLEE